MGAFERTLTGDLDEFVAFLDRRLPTSSMSASAEGGSDLQIGEARMAVRVYERYSAFSGSRVSLCVSVLGVGDQLAVSAVTAGGSRAVLWKMDTVGEESFLEKAHYVIASFGGD